MSNTFYVKCTKESVIARLTKKREACEQKKEEVINAKAEAKATYAEEMKEYVKIPFFTRLFTPHPVIDCTHDYDFRITSIIVKDMTDAIARIDKQLEVLEQSADCFVYEKL